MNSKKALLLSLFFVFSQSLWAEECSEFDLRKPEHSMYGLGVVKQEMGTCYANTVSLANDAWENQNNLSTDALRTVYLALASAHGAEKHSRFFPTKGTKVYFEAGTPRLLLGIMKDMGQVCVSKKGESLLEKLSDGILSEDVSKLIKLYEVYFYSHKDKSDYLSSLQKKQFYKEILERLGVEDGERLESFLKKVPISGKRISVLDFSHGMIMEGCEGFKKIGWSSTQGMDLDTLLESKFPAELKSSFINYFASKENAQPIIVGYCSEAMKNNDLDVEEIRVKPYEEKDNYFKSKCGNHASLIVARYMEGGKCKIVIRDNYICDPGKGEKCNGVDFVYDNESFLPYVLSLNVIED